MQTHKNAHGIECVTAYIGSHFAHWYIIHPKTGARVRLTTDSPPEHWDLPSEEVVNDTFDVPVICLSCLYYDQGDFGDFGELLGGPLCAAYVRFPIRKGSCRRRRA